MKLSIIFPAAVVISILGCSCAFTGQKNQVDEPVKLRDFSVTDEQQAYLEAEKFVNGFAGALQKNDFKLWQQVIPADSASKIGEKQFEQMSRELHREFGTFTGSSYLGVLTSGNLRSFMWKLSFVRQNDGKNTVREIVYFVRIFCEEGKTPAISGFGVRVF